MFKRIAKTKHKSRQAFTLVELIIVLVILAIVAAMLVPALTGYIKKSKKEKYYEDAHYALVASQSVITEVYGMGLDPNDETSFATTTDHGNVYWYTDPNQSGSDKSAVWGDKVLALMDRQRDKNEPYILIFGVGSSRRDSADGKTGNVHTTELQQHTVYYLAYVATDKSPAVFYVNGEWSYKYPKNKTDPKSVIGEVTLGSSGSFLYKNTIQCDKNGNKLDKKDMIPLTFYVVSNKSGIDIKNASFWSESNKKSLKAHAEPYFKV